MDKVKALLDRVLPEAVLEGSREDKAGVHLVDREINREAKVDQDPEDLVNGVLQVADGVHLDQWMAGDHQMADGAHQGYGLLCL